MEDFFIAFDESGNTGSELLDKSQPVFVLASVRLTNTQADQLRLTIQTSAEELKFNKLKKYHKYHAQIIELLNHPLISEETVRLSIIHKPYSILVHTVDRLIEPLAYNDGFDLYKEGANLALANLLYFCTPVFCDSLIYEDYKCKFVNLFKRRDETSIDEFYSTVEDLIASCKNEQYKDVLVPILASYSIIDEILSHWNPYMFDAAITGFITLVDFWGRKTQKRFNVLADESKPLNHFLDYINIIKSEKLIEQELGYDRRKLILPLKIDALTFADSKSQSIVQIADLIAGAANHYFRSLVSLDFSDDLATAIGKTKIVELLHSPVWPHKSVTPQDLGTDISGGNNLTDKMTDILNED